MRLRPRIDRIAAHVLARLPVVVPGVSGGRPWQFGQVEGDDFTSADDWFTGSVLFDDALGSGMLRLRVWAAGAPAPCAESVAPDTCSWRALPDGSTLETSEHIDQAMPGQRHLTVRHLRLDGASVAVTTFTYDSSRPVTSDDLREAYPLSQEQLAALATDPEVTI